MKTYSAEELKEILVRHGKWLRSEDGGSRADLAGADLADAYLARANLARANLAGAYLAGADLADAYLAGADLAGADLADAYLARANLAGANLAGADLAGADLAGAYLAGADLAGADLAGAYLAGADLAGANLAGAYLAGADLAGADLARANLARANLRSVRGLEKARGWLPMAPVVSDLDARVAEATSRPDALEMSRWHACETTHCRAGWAITLAGEAGRVLEAIVGPATAGALIYVRSTGRLPDFFCGNDKALADIQRCAADPGEPIAEVE